MRMCVYACACMREKERAETQKRKERRSNAAKYSKSAKVLSVNARAREKE